MLLMTFKIHYLRFKVLCDMQLSFRGDSKASVGVKQKVSLQMNLFYYSICIHVNVYLLTLGSD